jgi:hypothetical protein
MNYRTLLAAALALPLNTHTAGADVKHQWWLVDALGLSCIRAHASVASPAYFLGNGQIIKDDGTQVVVTGQVRDTTETHTFFRSKEACEQWLAQYE